MHSNFSSFLRLLPALLAPSLVGAQTNAPTPTQPAPWPTARALEVQPNQPVPLDQLLLAHAPELILVPELHGVIFIADPADVKSPVPAGFTGIDVSRSALLRGHSGVEDGLRLFLGQPASLPSLGRIATIVRVWLHQQGDSFATAYVPPQDLTEGIVRIVVARARLDGEVTVEGAKYFSTQQYRAALTLAPGGELDAAALRAATEALNQNPFHHVTSTVEPGATPGSSRLALQIEEKRPWQVTAGYNNAGSPSIGEDQLSAGFTWGNAFGRGDVLNYNFASDPQAEHLISHSGSYTSFLGSGRTLTFSGAWSKIVGDLPAPLAQTGHSWQLGANYAVALHPLREGWTQNLSFSADFKSSDNTLEFATIPITNNLTHIAEVGATYGISFRSFGGRNSVSVSGYASPGGLTRYNDDRAFDGSRPGAKADYLYGTLRLSHQHPLPAGFALVTNATAQLASGALLGSEQLNGAGSAGVRGYAESSAFGDAGVVVNNELHAPSFTLRDRAHVDLFAFVDAASLNLDVDRQSTDLRSAGFGTNLQVGQHASVRFAYGWQLKHLDQAPNENGHGHIAVNVSW